MNNTSSLRKQFSGKQPLFAAALISAGLFLAGQTQAQTFTNTYSTSGTNAFVIPAGVTQITVQAWGGGGGGHQASGNGERPGGGGGAYARSSLTVTSGASYSIIVGSGGAAGNPGTNGGPSLVRIGSTTNVLAAGGDGAATTSGAGSWKAVANSIGTVRFAGGNSIDGAANNGGGGGGSAFTNANGSNGAVTAGGTGTGAGGNGGTSGNVGQNGNAPGGGGGGRGDNGVTSGNGAVGRVIVVYTVSAAVPAKIAYITAPQTISQGQTSAVITVQLQATNNAVALATNNVTINLTSSLSGVFRGASVSNAITSIVISNGQSQASFRYSSSVIGNHVLTSSNSLLGATNQTLTITAPPVPAKVVFTTSPQSVVVSNSSGLITVELQSTNNLTANATNNVTVNLSSSLAGIFRNAADSSTITFVVISNGQSSASFRYRPSILGNHLLTAAAAGLTSGTQAFTAVAASSIIQTFYVPFDEDGASRFFNSITPDALDFVNVNVISLSIFASNTVVYYDHWEDGYEANLAVPTQSTTEVWGNLTTADGCPPNGTNPVTCVSSTNDIVDRGQVVFSFEQIPIPRNPANIFRDGRDKIGVTRPVALSRSGWDTGPATLLAGSVEVADTAQWGIRYEMPAGTNVVIEGQRFNITGVSVMALTNNTVVALDLDRNGSFEIVTNINEGQAYNITNFIVVAA